MKKKPGPKRADGVEEIILSPKGEEYLEYVKQNNKKLYRLHRELSGDNLAHPPRPTYE